MHFDGDRELWLSPTVADGIALAAARAEGRAAAIADLRARTGYESWCADTGRYEATAEDYAAYLEAKGRQP